MKNLGSQYEKLAESEDVAGIEAGLFKLDKELGRAFPTLDAAALQWILKHQKAARQRLNRLKGARARKAQHV